MFDGPLNQKEENVKATCILLWIGEEGRKIFNSFELSDEEKQKLDVILDKFATYVGDLSRTFALLDTSYKVSDSVTMNQ